MSEGVSFGISITKQAWPEYGDRERIIMKIRKWNGEVNVFFEI